MGFQGYLAEQQVLLSRKSEQVTVRTAIIANPVADFVAQLRRFCNFVSANSLGCVNCLSIAHYYKTFLIRGNS